MCVFVEASPSSPAPRKCPPPSSRKKQVKLLGDARSASAVPNTSTAQHPTDPLRRAAHCIIPGKGVGKGRDEGQGRGRWPALACEQAQPSPRRSWCRYGAVVEARSLSVTRRREHLAGCQSHACTCCELMCAWCVLMRAAQGRQWSCACRCEMMHARARAYCACVVSSGACS